MILSKESKAASYPLTWMGRGSKLTRPSSLVMILSSNRKALSSKPTKPPSLAERKRPVSKSRQLRQELKGVSKLTRSQVYSKKTQQHSMVTIDLRSNLMELSSSAMPLTSWEPRCQAPVRDLLI